MRPIVLLATVPARRESCAQLLECLAVQSVAPTVLLVGDGYRSVSELPPVPAGLGVMPCTFNPARGAGNRFLLAERLLGEGTLKDDDAIITIDDDMIPTIDFVRDAVQALIDNPNAAISWAGMIDSMLGAFLHGTRRARLRVLCTFAAAFPARAVRNIGEHPDATLLLGKQGDDELLLSHHCVKNGFELVRPWGLGPAFSGPAQKDVVAQHRNPRSREVQEARQRLYAAQGIFVPAHLLPSPVDLAG